MVDANELEPFLINENAVRQAAIDAMAHELKALPVASWSECIKAKEGLHDIMIEVEELVYLITQFDPIAWTPLIKALESYSDEPGEFLAIIIGQNVKKLLKTIPPLRWKTLVDSMSLAGLSRIFNSSATIDNLTTEDEDEDEDENYAPITPEQQADFTINILPAKVLTNMVEPREDENVFYNLHALLEIILGEQRLNLIHKLGSELENNRTAAGYIKHIIERTPYNERNAHHIASLLVMLSYAEKVDLLNMLGNEDINTGIRYLIEQFPFDNRNNLAWLLYSLEEDAFSPRIQHMLGNRLAVIRRTPYEDDPLLGENNSHMRGLLNYFFQEVDHRNGNDDDDETIDNPSVHSETGSNLIGPDDDDDAPQSPVPTGLHLQYSNPNNVNSSPREPVAKRPRLD